MKPSLRTPIQFAAAAAILLSACAPAPPTPTATATLRPTATSTAIRTVTATFAPLSTALPTLTPLPTFTPLPTLPPDEALNKILNLLANNGGCKLPCFWGIIPGETTSQDAYNFLKSLSSQIDSIGTINGKDGVEEFGMYYKVPNYVSALEAMYFGYRAENGLVDSIVANSTMTLAELLNTHGRPAEVWIRARPVGLAILQIHMGVFYPDQNILAVYYQEDATYYSTTGIINACFDENKGILFNNLKLHLWTADQSFTWQDFDPFSLWDSQPSLEEATGMDTETFYNKYKDPNTRPCIETPEEIWRGAPSE